MGRTATRNVVGQPVHGHSRRAAPGRGHGRRRGGHRHQLSDARTGAGGHRWQTAAAGHHLVRQPRRALRRTGDERPGGRLLPGPSAELAGQLHCRQAGMGARERARSVPEGVPLHAAGRLHCHAADGRDDNDHERTVGGHTVGLQGEQHCQPPYRILRH